MAAGDLVACRQGLPVALARQAGDGEVEVGALVQFAPEQRAEEHDAVHAETLREQADQFGETFARCPSTVARCGFGLYFAPT